MNENSGRLHTKSVISIQKLLVQKQEVAQRRTSYERVKLMYVFKHLIGMFTDRKIPVNKEDAIKELVQIGGMPAFEINDIIEKSAQIGLITLTHNNDQIYIQLVPERLSET